MRDLGDILKESIFDVDEIESSSIDSTIVDPKFKKWINRPDILFYLYQYWADDEDMFLSETHPEWKEYKPVVDIIFKELNKSMKKTLGQGEYSWVLFNYDTAGFDDHIRDIFDGEENYEASLGDVIYEIQHKLVDMQDGVAKTWFKGGIPKNSVVKYFFDYMTGEYAFLEPGKLAGAIMLTQGDVFMFLGFPKSTPGWIKKLFNL